MLFMILMSHLASCTDVLFDPTNMHVNTWNYRLPMQDGETTCFCVKPKHSLFLMLKCLFPLNNNASRLRRCHARMNLGKLGQTTIKQWHPGPRKLSDPAITIVEKGRNRNSHWSVWCISKLKYTVIIYGKQNGWHWLFKNSLSIRRHRTVVANQLNCI